ncbi:NUD17 protein, partial [Syrrhaptes paradoxus]|nr:NUD17 protein [Syrrhaptes paradoxus]
VSCGLAHGTLLLSDVPFPGSTSTLLQVGGDRRDAGPLSPQRPPFCPAKHLGERRALPAELRGRGVAAGVAVLLEASTGRILLTRRAGTLRAFPSVWVPPGESGLGGGHGALVTLGLLDVGLRELAEETGLRLDAGTFSWRLLGLWESLYPPMLSRGLPRRHHIVAYLLLRSDEPHERLEARMCPSESEVSAYAWLEPAVLAAIAATEDGAESSGDVPSALPATVGIVELSSGSSSSARLPTSTLLRTAPAQGEDLERVSTGTKFALRLWLEGTRDLPHP